VHDVIQGKILLVDDDTFTRNACRTALERAGHQVCAAVNYDQAIILADFSVDLVLVDLVPEGKSGIEILKFIRQHHSDCPVIMISAVSNKCNVIAALREGATDYLEKPVEPEELLLLVQRWLSCRSLKQENAHLQDYKAMADALQVSEERFANIFDIAHDAIIAVTPDQIIKKFNKSAEIAFGYQASELLGKPLDILLPEYAREAHQQQVDNFLAGEDVMRPMQGYREIQGRRKDGSLFFAEATISKLDTANGVMLTAMLRDITARKQAEADLKKTRERHEEAQRIAHLGHWALDLVKNELVWSDEECRIFGVKPGVAHTYDFFLKTVHPDDREFVDRDYTESVKNKTLHDIEHRLLMPDGAIKWVHERCETFYAEDGTPLNSIGTTLDITERKQMEDELKEHRLHLEELVEQRTAELIATQGKLFVKERLAALGQVIATVGHELRNPLGTIRTSIHTLASKTREANLGLEKIMERMNRSISRCDNIINELRDFTNLNPLDLQPTQFDDWLNATLNAMDIPEGISLRRNLVSGARLDIDHGRIRRVVINLLNNACQALTASKVPTGIVTVSSRKVSADQLPEASRLALGAKKQQTTDIKLTTTQFLEFVFEDNGPGIAPEILARLYEPLFSTKAFGVGLGLSVVKLIMEQHGGGLHIESKQDKGTQVLLWLPLEGSGV